VIGKIYCFVFLGLFGSLNQPKPATGFFSSATTSAAPFGGTSSGFSFNTTATQSSGLFGTNTNTTSTAPGMGTSTGFGFQQPQQQQQQVLYFVYLLYLLLLILLKLKSISTFIS